MKTSYVVVSLALLSLPLLPLLGAACSSTSDGAAPEVGEAGAPALGSSGSSGGGPLVDAGKARVDGGFATPDGGVLPLDRFATRVVSFTPGECAGFGVPAMPDVVLGPPVGAGDRQGGLDVVSLGQGGSIVLAFEPGVVRDAPGPDFVVFENAFFAGGDPSRPFAEPAEVAVSEDGVTFHPFPCAAAAPWAGCAGTHPVYSAPDNGISPFDPAVSGGDAFDLADVGLARARFVRIVDRSPTSCPSGAGRPNNFGFDLDAVAIVHP